MQAFFLKNFNFFVTHHSSFYIPSPKTHPGRNFECTRRIFACHAGRKRYCFFVWHDPTATGYLSLEGRYYPHILRCHRQCCQQYHARMLYPLPRMHQQRDPFGCRHTAPLGMFPHHGTAGKAGNSRQGENHCCLQSSLPLYPPYRRTAHMRKVTEKDCRLLASSYRSCLEIATDRHLKCIAFCCISKGEFHFPSKRAAEIAIQTVQDFIKQNKNSLEVIFNVFKDNDFGIYKRLLQ